MKKRLVSAFLAFALILGLVPVSDGAKVSAEAYRKGCILPDSLEPSIFDALEILKYFVNMPSEISKSGRGSRAWNAALISSASLETDEPSVFDALEILKYIVCMSNRIGVNPRPSAPQNLRAEPSDGKVRISWTAPTSAGKSAIKHYEVSKDGSSWTAVQETGYTFAELSLGASYTFSVRAVNGTHTGSPSTVTAAAKKPVPVKPDFWHSDSSRVGFWNKKSIAIEAQTIGEISSGFAFAPKLNDACAQWSEALEVNITVSSAGTSDIQAYGGRKPAMQELSGNFSNGWAGLCNYSYNVKEQVGINGAGVKDIDDMKKAKLYFVDKAKEVWTKTDTDRSKCVITHELGHALGYMGHPEKVTANNQNVMWYMEHEQYILQYDERRHLRQVYGYYNR